LATVQGRTGAGRAGQGRTQGRALQTIIKIQDRAPPLRRTAERWGLPSFFDKAGWPSWLWRQVKVYLNSNLLVRETERGFKSHSCQYVFFAVHIVLPSPRPGSRFLMLVSHAIYCLLEDT
jgi:hypothetical protein